MSQACGELTQRHQFLILKVNASEVARAIDHGMNDHLRHLIISLGQFFELRLMEAQICSVGNNLDEYRRCLHSREWQRTREGYRFIIGLDLLLVLLYTVALKLPFEEDDHLFKQVSRARDKHPFIDRFKSGLTD